MSKKRITYIHIFIWLFAIFANLPYSTLNHNSPPLQIVSNIIGFLYLMVVFYLFYLVMVPFLVTRKRLDLFFIISFLVVLIMPFFGYTILFTARALFEGSFQHFYNDYSFKMHMSGYFPVLTAAVFGSFFGVIINWFKTMNQKAELDKQKLAIELELIKSKLNPHFLFNTLNNIDSLIHQNPEEASSALIRLSEMMRYLTYETVSDVVELIREIDYIRNFIELNKIRIKSPDDIRFEVTGDQNIMIPPAIFIPLVENAFKFASFRSKKPCIDIKLTSDKGTVVFEITNYHEKNNAVPRKNSGLGLINLKKRLDLTYPHNYQLIIEPGEELFHAKLTINTNAN
ncbi:MAG TPA: histidine kinase [Bacteroidales bacterium]|nr:histidine kinase [Bacteroidales bacterium]